MNINCSNCIGETKIKCEQLLDDEVTTIKTIQILDNKDLDEVEERDNVASEVFVADAQTAALQEGADLVDYRHQVLSEDMLEINCSLSSEEIRQKLIIRLAEN